MIPKNVVKRVEQAKQAHGLGRLPAADERDRLFTMRAALPMAAPVRTTRYWPFFADALDQGALPHCVAYAWLHFLLAAPTVHGAGPTVLGSIDRFTRSLYGRAQAVDEWEGEDYDGTSVRAGAKVLKADGRLAEYRWAWDIDTVQRYVLSRGPVVFGTNWYERMFVLTDGGYLKPEGALVGGHAYMLIGYSETRRAFRILNSWGEQWGQKGRAWLDRDDAAGLLRDWGEACSAVEQKLPATAADGAVVSKPAAAA